MTRGPTQLEFLANELLLDIFDCLDANDLFRAFYDLNNRFNSLLQSMNNLSLTLKMPGNRQTIHSQINLQDVQAIILGQQAIGHLNNFPNLRRLKFLQPTCQQFNKLASVDLPHLEHLFMGNGHSCSLSFHVNHKHHHCDKISSNHFLNLKSCYSFHPDVLHILPRAIESTQFRILRLGKIDLKNYRMVLSTCPNLYFLRLELPTVQKTVSMGNSYENLRRMVIDFDYHCDPLKDYDLDNYLSCVPNLEQLSVYRPNEKFHLSSYLNYNWHAAAIDRYLPSLHRFKYHLGIYSAEELIENDSEKILDRLEESFRRVHSNRYQSKLLFKFCALPIVA